MNQTVVLLQSVSDGDLLWTNDTLVKQENKYHLKTTGI